MTTVCLDDLKLEKCRLIKIDVDGNELDVLQSGEATIKKLRPILYVENDIREKSRDLLEYLMAMDYSLYWHIAPLVSADNYFGNSTNYWSPNGLVSLMVLGIPREHNYSITGLASVSHPDEWVM